MASTGGHNLILQGSDGSGQRVIARRVGTILLRLSRCEAIATSKTEAGDGLARVGLPDFEWQPHWRDCD